MFVQNIVDDKEIMALKKPIIDACIKAAEKNGWSDATGILRGVLFLEKEPMSLDVLAEKTGYSKTTVRSSINCMENIGMAVRIVGPVGKSHHGKQHRYSLETDAEAIRPVILSAAREEIHLILQALNQVEKNMEPCGQEADEMRAMLVKTRQFYKEMDNFMELMNQFSLKELIEILEREKK